MKNIVQIAIYTFIIFGTLSAQVHNGIENGENSSGGSTTTNASKSAVISNVDHFGGSYNLSHDLGTVTSSSGTSFSAKLSYSSVYTSNTDSDYLSGVPYGDGWNINIPTLSVSTDVYHKYTLQETDAIFQTPDETLLFNEEENCEEALKEGDLYWFAPTISLPGLGSSKLVFAPKENSSPPEEAAESLLQSAAAPVIPSKWNRFIPQNFQTFFEVFINGTLAIAVLNDGTVYTFRVLQNPSYREAANQRYQTECDFQTAFKANENMFLPKSETTMFYCTEINNYSKVTEQESISTVDFVRFKYKKYGRVDYVSHLNERRHEISEYYTGSAINANWPVTYKKVILHEIESDIERVVLNYDYVEDIPEGLKIPSYSADNDNLDSLYVNVVEKEWNLSDLKNEWNKYVHIKSSDFMSTTQDAYVVNSGNPYIGIGLDGRSSLFRKEIQNNEPFAFNDKVNENEYNSGYLESPALSFEDFIRGADYRIKLRSNYEAIRHGMVLFDINVVTGVSKIEDAIESSSAGIGIFKQINSKCYDYGINQSIHSTFRNGIKHALGADQFGNGYVNNEVFRMSNLSGDFKNFRIQIGAANSDTKYSYDLCQLDTGAPIERTYYNNFDNAIDVLDASQGDLLSGHAVRNNFGVGLPWYSLQGMFPLSVASQGLASWWSTETCDLINKPVSDALVSGSQSHPEITNIELIRIAKMPLVLKKSSKQLRNTSGEWVVQNVYGYNYSLKQANHLTVTALYNDDNGDVSEIKKGSNGSRYIIVLDKITRLPSDGDDTDASIYPTDHFEYEAKEFSDADDQFGNVAHFWVLNKHTDPLGKIDRIVYNENDLQIEGLYECSNGECGNFAILNNYVATRWWLPQGEGNDLDECLGQCSQDALQIKRIGSPISLSIHLVVKEKIEQDANGEQSTTYQYSNYINNASFYNHLGVNFKRNNGNLGAVESGFQFCEVTMPNVGQNPNPISKYEFEIVDKNMLGILKKVQNYSGASLLSESSYEYDNVRVYKVPEDFEEYNLPDFPDGTVHEGAKFHTWRFLPNGSAAKDEVSSSYFTRLNKVISSKPYGGEFVEEITEFKYYECDDEFGVTNVDAFADLDGTNTLLEDFPTFSKYEIKKSFSSSLRSCESHPSTVTTKIYNHYDNYLSGVNSDFGIDLYNFGLKNLPYRIVNESTREDSYRSATFFTYYEDNFLLKEERVSNSQIIDPANSILKSEFLEYDLQFRKPTRVKDIANRIASTKYNLNGTPQYTKIESSDGLSFMTSYTYNLANALVEEVTDPNDIVVKTTYDNLNRPNKTYRNNRLLTDVYYSNWNNEEKSFADKSIENYISTRTIVDVNLEFVSKSLLDPLGRSVATIIDTDDMVSNTIYDFYGRAIESVRPHVSSMPTLSYTNSSDNVNTRYSSYPNNQIEEVATYTHALGGANNESYTYAVVSDQEMASSIANAGNTYIPQHIGCSVLKEEYRDNDNKLTTTYRDLTGATLAVLRPIDANTTTAATTFQLDERNNITIVSNPKSQQTTYNFNYLNQLYQKNSLDKGEEKFGYDQLGNLIAYSSNGNIDLYHYDNHGRNLVHGKGNTTTFFDNEGVKWLTNGETYQNISGSVASSIDDLFSTYHYEAISTAVDVPPNLHQLLSSNDVGLNRLSQTISYDETGAPVETKFFGYDTDGFISWDANLMNYNGITSSSPGFVFMTQYRHTVSGLVKEKYVDLNLDFTLDFGCINTYDNRGRLKSVTPKYLHPGASQNLTKPLAEYSYDDLTDLVQSIRLSGTADYESLRNCPDPCIDEQVDFMQFFYDSKYRLTTIRSTHYYESLFYDATLASNANVQPNWNGNINSTSHQYIVPGQLDYGLFNDNVNERTESYIYDGLNRLTSVNSFKSDDPNVSLDWSIIGDNSYQYDKIGNLTRLTRNEISDQISNEQFTNIYNYNSQNNKLQNIVSTSSTGGSETWNYGYNQDGNITSDDHRDVGSIDYYRQILPSKINLDILSSISPNIQYLYNSADSRIVKRTDVSSLGAEVLEYYLKDASGQEMGIYDVNADKLVWYIYGDRMLASIDHTGYIECDHPIITDDPTGGGGLGTGIGGGFTPKFYNASTLSDNEIDQGNTDNQLILSAISGLMVNNNGNISYDLPATLIKYEENGVKRVGLDKAVLTDPRYTIIDTLPIFSPSQSISLYDRDGKVRQKRLYEILAPDKSIQDYQYFTSNVAPYGSSQGHVMQSLAGPGSNPQYTVPPAPSFYIQDHLGNTRVKYDLICNDGKMEHRIQELHDYHPFGKTMRSYSLEEDERYLFTGKERDAKIGYDYFGARYYDSEVGRFLSVDPLSDQRSWLAPYNYAQNNPLNRIDPDGRLDNPIYDQNGDFLGTDDKGLQGDAIVMNSADFTQGMSNSDALAKGSTLNQSCGSNCISSTIFNKVLAHQSTLSSRPDYDGKLTLDEANDWYRNGGGDPLYVDASQIDLDPIYNGDIAKGKSQYVNYASPENANFGTGLVYGTIKLTSIDGKGQVQLGGSNGLLDNYGFEMQNGRPMRNAFTKLGEWNAGSGKSYDIYNYGSGQLNKKPKPIPRTYPSGLKY